MKTINLDDQTPSLGELLLAARCEPILLVEPTGGEYVLAVADDFEAEVASLRASPAFQEFLDRRSQPTRIRPLNEYLRELDAEQTRDSPTAHPT